MHERELFRQALGLTPPWEVREVSFDADRGRLELRLDFPKGSTFSCPECGREECPAYDTTTKRWRHLDFFEHDTILEARVPGSNAPSAESSRSRFPGPASSPASPCCLKPTSCFSAGRCR